MIHFHLFIFFFFLGVIQKPISKEDEIQNIQLVIDILSRDILHTSLAHITGREVVDGNRESIWNLLEIFGGLLEYILNKIDSDASTDGTVIILKKMKFHVLWSLEVHVLGEGLTMTRLCSLS